MVQVAMGELGLLHRKCYNVALANAYEGLGQGKRTFRVPVSVVSDWCEFKSHNYQALYDVFEELRVTPVKSVTFDEKEAKKGRKRKRVSGDGLLSSFAIIEGGIIEYSFSDHMAEILHEPEQYIWLSLNAQNKFDSKYELNLFENCVRYISVGSTGFKPLEDWRGLLGAKDPYYDDFKNFNRKVLKAATQGVCDKSGIIVSPEFEREKRKVSKIKFTVSENPQMQLFDHKEHSRIRESAAYKRLVEIGLQDVEAIHWINKKGEAGVLENIAYVEAKKPDKNPTGYMVAALRAGYGDKSLEERKREEAAQKQLAKNAEAREQKAQAEQAEEMLKAEFSTYQKSRAQDLIELQDEASITALGQIVADALVIREMCQRWEAIKRDPSQLDLRKSNDRIIFGGYVVAEALKLWGDPQDLDFEEYKKQKSAIS
ncbi:MAG: replication initiation protein [Tateyamaria sp.]|uniref:replication initiation protein n=1 Tax=Tateyamaria sp. TaxID=1929288 RepID=UPI003269B947